MLASATNWLCLVAKFADHSTILATSKFIVLPVQAQCMRYAISARLIPQVSSESADRKRARPRATNTRSKNAKSFGMVRAVAGAVPKVHSATRRSCHNLTTEFHSVARSVPGVTRCGKRWLSQR